MKKIPIYTEDKYYYIYNRVVLIWDIRTKALSGTISRTSQTVTDGVERVILLC